MEFKVGDKAVHPKYGVVLVSAIEDKDLGGSVKTCYVFLTADTDQIVVIPTDMIERVGLRPIISKKDAEKVLAVLRENKVAVTSQPWNRRQREYNEMLYSGSPFEVAKVIRDITRLKSAKDLSFGERTILEQARRKLITELALARKCKEDRVEAEIQGILAS